LHVTDTASTRLLKLAPCRALIRPDAMETAFVRSDSRLYLDVWDE